MSKAQRYIRKIGNNDLESTMNFTMNGKRVRHPIYKTWDSMLARCYSQSYQQKYPSYAGCGVVKEWLNFSAFKAWMEIQDWEGKQLDKDLLVIGNKTYGPDTCVFISRQLNSFISDTRPANSAYPIGVRVDKIRGRFDARCRNPATLKQETLGRFDTAEEAHEEWRKRKHELACIYADQQTDPRVANALRTRYAEANKP